VSTGVIFVLFYIGLFDRISIQIYNVKAIRNECTAVFEKRAARSGQVVVHPTALLGNEKQW